MNSTHYHTRYNDGIKPPLWLHNKVSLKKAQILGRVRVPIRVLPDCHPCLMSDKQQGWSKTWVVFGVGIRTQPLLQRFFKFFSENENAHNCAVSYNQIIMPDAIFLRER